MRSLRYLLYALWRKRPTARARWERDYHEAASRRDWQTCDYLLDEEPRGKGWRHV